MTTAEFLDKLAALVDEYETSNGNAVSCMESRTPHTGGLMFLHDLFDLDFLNHMLDERFVIQRTHPTKPLRILNYGERCQFEPDRWNEVTSACRGLIYHADTTEVLARPFNKFFNHGQPGAPPLDLTSPTLVTDKLDGSLGILYHDGDDWAIATRGSFESEQAIHATEVWRARYAEYQPPKGYTLLFEIVFPANRIVVNYGGLDDLVLLGARHLRSGVTLGPQDPELFTWWGPRATVFGYSTLAEALAAPIRENAEGLVIHDLRTDQRVKIKQEDYVALHRIVTGLNERVVWEHLVADKPLSELLEPLPDEFHPWVKEVAVRLLTEYQAIGTEAERVYREALDNMSVPTLEEVGGSPLALAKAQKKAFALRIATHPYRALLFKMYEGRDYTPLIWDLIYPAGLQKPSGLDHSEANA